MIALPLRLVSLALAIGAVPPLCAQSTLPDASDGRFRERFLAWDAPLPLGSVTLSQSTLRPVDRMTLSSGFGPRAAPTFGASSFHPGVDIPSATGTPVRAVADGVVVRSGWAGGYGNLVEIDHGGGLRTRYGHLSTIYAGLLGNVRRGDTIGAVGSTGISTGSHLHYEVRIDGRPVDPMPWLAGVLTITRTITPYDDRPTISAFAKARDAVALPSPLAPSGVIGTR